jgi:hypothetical protein
LRHFEEEEIQKKSDISELEIGENRKIKNFDRNENSISMLNKKTPKK